MIVHLDISHDVANPGGNPFVAGSVLLPGYFGDGDGDRMILDASNDRLMVSDQAEEDLFLIDTAANKLSAAAIGASNVGFVDVGANGCARSIRAALGRVYIANELTGALRIADSNSGSFIQTIASAGFLTGIAIDPANERIWVNQTGANTPSYFDGVTFAKTGFAALGDLLQGPFVDPGTGATAFVRVTEKSATAPTRALYFVRPDGTFVTTTLTASVADDFIDAAVDPVAKKLYVSANLIRVYDTDPLSVGFGSLLATFAVAGANFRDIRVDSGTNTAFVGDETASLSNMYAIDGSTGATLWSRTVSLSSDGTPPFIVDQSFTPSRLYVADNVQGRVVVLDAATGGLIAAIPVPNSPPNIESMTLLPSTNAIYMLDNTQSGDDTSDVLALDTGTNTISVVFGGPFAIDVGDDVNTEERMAFAASSANMQLYVLEREIDQMTVIDADPTSASFHSVTAVLSTGIGPIALAVSEATGRIFVINEGGNIDVFAGPATAVPYGCGVNPAGSMTVISGVPSIGTTVVLGVDNPLGTQAAGALPFVGLSLAPDSSFPCGTPIPGLGMAAAGAAGELLINLPPPGLIQPILVGPPWIGPGTPAPVSVVVPANPGLVGVSVYAQGVLFDPTFALGIGVALTDAVVLSIGT